MAKFLAELLGCTLPDKSSAPLFERRSQPPLGLRPSSKQRTTFFGTLTNERALLDNRLLRHVPRRHTLSDVTRKRGASVWSVSLCLHPLRLDNMNPPMINSTNSVSTTRRKREAERSVNWTAEETQVLLCAWSDERVQKSLAENLRNRHVFKHLSARMCEMGFTRSPHQCRLRVKTLKANYVRAKLQRSVDAAQPCTFKYFAEMDAVLGRRSAGGDGGTRFTSPEGTAERRLVSVDGTRSVLPDLNSGSEVGGHHFYSFGRSARQRLVSLEEETGCQMDSEVKMEDGEDSTDEFELSDSGFSQHPRDRRHEVYLEAAIQRELSATTMDNSLSSPSPSPLAAPPPLPAPPQPPPLVQSAASPLLPPPDANPASSGRRGPAPSSSSSSSYLEPVLQHLSACFQQLVSETRGLLVQLEAQRQEQARWHQELLAQWLQREERRQREAAEREERREKARMEHEIRVLELLTGLSREQSCRCAGNQAAPEAAASESHR